MTAFSLKAAREAGIAHDRYPWTESDERFVIQAKIHRFSHKDIAHVLQRTPGSVNQKIRKLQAEGVLQRHRKEEIELLNRLLEEARLASDLA